MNIKIEIEWNRQDRICLLCKAFSWRRGKRRRRRRLISTATTEIHIHAHTETSTHTFTESNKPKTKIWRRKEETEQVHVVMVLVLVLPPPLPPIIISCFSLLWSSHLFSLLFFQYIHFVCVCGEQFMPYASIQQWLQ